MVHVIRRPDIDGLRALAILSVMVFHFNAHWLPGGFVGVDIFFVISAFLITGRIYKDMLAGQFSFRDFYVRRVKRIFPATILVFMVAVFFASQLNGLLLPDAKYVLTFLFNKHTSNYFTSDSQTNFFLHYWSLSIEEQFYFIWPLLLAPLMIWGRRLLARAPYVLPLLIAVVCFTLGILWSADPAHAADLYFLSIPRFGEMAVGAAVAMMPPLAGDRPLLRALGGACGLALLAASFVWLREAHFPGAQALLPCAGAALLIHCGRADGRPGPGVYRVIGSRPLAFVGLISFSLYLWHWPVFAITRLVAGDAALPDAWAPGLFAGVFALATATYYGVERPCIRAKPGPMVVLPAFGAVSAAAFGTILLLTGVEEWGMPPIIGAEYTNVTINGQNTHLTSGWAAPCFDRTFDRHVTKQQIDTACALNGPGPAPDVLLVGDSHAAAFGAFAQALGKKEGFRVTALAVGACQISEWGLAARAPAVVRTPERIDNCNTMLDYIERNYRSYKAIYVVNAFNLFSGGYNVFTKQAEAPPSFRVDKLREIAAVTPVYFFHDSPVIDHAIQYSPIFAQFGFQPGANRVKGGEEGNGVIRNLVSAVPNVHWISLKNEYDSLGRNKFIYNGRPVYVDTNHLNGYGARMLADIFMRDAGGCLTCARTIVAASGKQ